MRFPIITILCLLLIVSSSWAQSIQLQTSGGQGSISGSLSFSGNLIDTLLHPLRPFLGETGHRALHNAIETIPISVLNQVSTLGQLFGALVTFNPTAVPRLINQLFPGASSMFASALPSLLPYLGSAGLSALTSMATSGLGSPMRASLSSSPLSSIFRQNFPTSQSENTGTSSSPSNRGLNAFNPSNIASNLVGQGLSNFAGITSSLANGQPLSALLTMAGGAADTVNRFGNLATNLATNGLNKSSKSSRNLSGSKLPPKPSRFSSKFSSSIPDLSTSTSADGSVSAGGTSYDASASASASGLRRGSMYLSPFANYFANNPYTSSISE